MDSLSARFIKKKRKWVQINKIRNEGRELTTNITEIQKITREYYQKLYASTLDNLEDMETFLEIYKLPRQNHEEIDNLN